MDPEQGECGSGSATSGPPTACDLGKRESVWAVPEPSSRYVPWPGKTCAFAVERPCSCGDGGVFRRHVDLAGPAMLAGWVWFAHAVPARCFGILSGAVPTSVAGYVGELLRL